MAKPSLIQQVKLSDNELSKKMERALCGVGFHWGVSEEMRLLSSQISVLGASYIEFLVMYLEQIERKKITIGKVIYERSRWSSTETALSPIMLGCALLDDKENAINWNHQTVSACDYPFILAPFFMSICQHQEVAVSLQWRETEIQCSSHGIEVIGSGDINTHREAEIDISVTSSLSSIPMTNRKLTTTISSSTYQKIAKLEALTFVPSTSESREHGAG